MRHYLDVSCLTKDHLFSSSVTLTEIS